MYLNLAFRIEALISSRPIFSQFCLKEQFLHLPSLFRTGIDDEQLEFLAATSKRKGGLFPEASWNAESVKISMWVFWGLFGSYWGFIANLTYFISILQRSYARFMYLKHLPCGVIRIYMTYIVENCTVQSSLLLQYHHLLFDLYEIKIQT